MAWVDTHSGAGNRGCFEGKEMTPSPYWMFALLLLPIIGFVMILVIVTSIGKHSYWETGEDYERLGIQANEREEDQ